MNTDASTRNLSARPALAPWPAFAQDEIDAVTRVLQSGKVNYWTGDEGRQFEKEFAEASGCRYAIAVGNGSLALELALHALQIPAGSEVITTARTFIASASCAVMQGCVPVIADVDPDSGNITAETIQKVLSPKTKAIIAVHLAGWPCDMDPILDLAESRGIKVIEDCAQATGAKYKGRPVGSMGHVGAFSFCQDKIITTGGEGGFLTTQDEEVWSRAWSFKDHGKSFDAVYHRQHAPGFRWLHESFGSNFRMLEVQAAIGRLQLRKLPDWHKIRAAHARAFAQAFAGVPAVRVPWPSEDLDHAWYKFYCYVEPQHLKDGWSRDRIMVSLSEQGVPCYSGSCSEIYREKAFLEAGLGPATPLRMARLLGETSLMFLVHPTLSEGEVGWMAERARRTLLEASR